MSNLSSKIDQGGVAPHLRFLKPMLLLELLAHKTLLSIPQTHLNVKFIFRKFCGIAVHGDIKYTTNPSECQIYFQVSKDLWYIITTTSQRRV